MSEIDFAPAVAGPDRLGQGTAVEQSRAVASVEAMMVVARRFPRDEHAARDRMLRTCRDPELAEKGIYTYTRGKTVTGMSIHAAVEIARCWGNLDYGLTEMRRDDVYGQSEMLAYCWELETNVCDRHTFIVPHSRTGSSKRLIDTRDIYETITNDGNRRMRETILRQLPRWYKTLAEKTLRATLADASAKEGVPLDDQLDQAAGWFLEEFGVALDQLEHKLGAQRRRWGRDDLIELRILGRSIKGREVTLDEAFPSAKVTADELAPEQPDEPQAEGAVEHLDHPDGAWVDGCPGCIAGSTSADQEAESGNGGGNDAA